MLLASQFMPMLLQTTNLKAQKSTKCTQSHADNLKENTFRNPSRARERIAQ
jgi:hypothetical protein